MKINLVQVVINAGLIWIGYYWGKQAGRKEISDMVSEHLEKQQKVIDRGRRD